MAFSRARMFKIAAAKLFAAKLASLSLAPQT